LRAHNALICSLFKEEYSKVHVFKSVKEMWNTILTILNKFGILNKYYDISNHIDKVLRNFPIFEDHMWWVHE